LRASRQRSEGLFQNLLVHWLVMLSAADNLVFLAN